ncbi:MAG TPA: hypothetical protein VFA50_14575 [Stellaceae bacterium]|nr:hypothetical protein [Stellaceae bacterium]
MPGDPEELPTAAPEALLPPAVVPLEPLGAELLLEPWLGPFPFGRVELL